MRTKLVLGAAILAAGLATSMAQNVYSLNVVGYYNVTAAGNMAYTILANQFTNSDNAIKTVLPSAAEGTLVWTYVNNTWNQDIFVAGDWYDNLAAEPTLSTTKLLPGAGFMYQNADASTATVTFVGEVPQGNGLTVPLGQYQTLAATFTPQALELKAANNFPQEDGMLHYTLLPDGITYQEAIQIGGDWYDNKAAEPTLVTVQPAVGTGWIVDRAGNPAPNDWVRNFTVN